MRKKCEKVKKATVFFTFAFFIEKNYILLENIFGKTCVAILKFVVLHLYCSFLAWQFFH